MAREGREGKEIRERTATTVERGASQFNHGDNRNNGFAYHRIYPLRLYIAALRGGGGATEEDCASSMSCKHT